MKNKDYDDYRIDIKERLDEPELLAQLAEEATELSHAALKLRRAIVGENPTPVTVEEARRKLVEEFADVWLSLEMVLTLEDVSEGIEVMNSKIIRWAERLEKKHGKKPNENP